MVTWESAAREIARRAGIRDVEPRVVAAAAILSCIVVAFALWRWWPSDATDEKNTVRLPARESPAAETGEVGSRESSRHVLVHVVGSVRRPGVYELAEGSRVVDAVNAAGGMLPDAVAAAINLARVTQDGEQVVVPDEDTNAASAGGVAGGTAGSGTSVSSGPIDLNTADATALDALPGVGPATAAKIVADREQNGPYSSVQDLGRVAGIGPKKLEQLKDLVCVP